MAFRASFLVGFVALTSLLAGCGKDPADGVVEVTVTDPGGAPVPGAFAAVEEGGSYNWSARAGLEPIGDEAVPPVPGAFTIRLPRGLKGFHIFADGFQVASAPFEVEPKDTSFQTLKIQATPMPEGAPRPSTGNLLLYPSSVEPGGAVTLSVDVTSGAEDPISDQVLALLPSEGSVAALTPPAPSGGAGGAGTGGGGTGGSGTGGSGTGGSGTGGSGTGGAGPAPSDTAWTAALTAPSARGTYTYYVVAANMQGMIAPILSATLLVE